MDWRDLIVRTGWTALAAALSFVAQALADEPTTWWAPVVTSAFTAVLVFVRQRAGEGVSPPG